MSRDPALRLEDILEAATAVATYVRGFDYCAFVADRRTVDAVTRNLEIIGEAVKHLPPTSPTRCRKFLGVPLPAFATSSPTATFEPRIPLSGMRQPAITHCSSLQFKHFLNSSEPQGRVVSCRRCLRPAGNVGFWIMNAERALTSLEKFGAALTGMAEGNFE